jgi:hypothetical protein
VISFSYISRLCIVTASGNNGGRCWDRHPGFALVQQVSGPTRAPGAQPNNLQHCWLVPCGGRNTRASFPSPCLISYSTPTDFINVLVSLFGESFWEGGVSRLTFLNFVSRIPCSIYNLGLFLSASTHSLWLCLFCLLFPCLFRSSVLDYLGRDFEGWWFGGVREGGLGFNGLGSGRSSRATQD